MRKDLQAVGTGGNFLSVLIVEMGSEWYNISGKNPEMLQGRTTRKSSDGKRIELKDRKAFVMCTKIQLDNISRQIVQSYRSVYGDNIVAIYLYGSYAREDYDNESDIDITAIVKGNRIDLQNQLKRIWDISADIGLENDVVVSPTVIPFDEYEEYKQTLPYYMNIWKEGKQIG